MTWETILNAIKNFITGFYQFAVTNGENSFVYIDKNYLIHNRMPSDVKLMFIASFAVIIVLTILACDSYRIFHPFTGMSEWKSKVSILNVLMFAAAVFSFHLFYKLLIGFTGNLMHSYASVAALSCLGTYINPISIMIYAYAVSTMSFQKKNAQALFLGWMLFLTPTVLSYEQFTDEKIVLYIVAAVIGIAGAILYKKCTPFVSYFVLSLIYYVCKYFMIDYSEEMLILTGETLIERIGQYFCCIQMDLILTLILMFILFFYKQGIIEKENQKIKKDVVLMGIFAVLLISAIVSNRCITVNAVKLEKKLPYYMIWNPKVEMPRPATSEVYVEEEEIIPDIAVIKVSANIRSGPGTNNGVVTVGQPGAEYVTTGNVEKAGDGKDWVEIYLDKDMTKTGWIFSSLVDIKEGESQKKKSEKGLVGVWKGDMGSELTLKELGKCYYIDGSSGEGSGSWSVDNNNVIHINSECLSYELYGTLEQGYSSTEVLLTANSSSWRDEWFYKE